VQQHPVLPEPYIVHFFLADVAENKSEHCLVFENNEVDLCNVDRGFNVDVEIEVTVKKLTKVWMGWEDFDEAVKDKTLKFTGPEKYTSKVAHIKKRQANLLVCSH
jgi:hypothetical protein